MKRVWRVRLTIETNEVYPDERPYYEDREMPVRIREWMDEALYDRDDHPHITWSEFVQDGPAAPPAAPPVADTGEINIIRGTG